jgi:hypothetical protein
MERGGHMEQAEDLVDIAWRALAGSPTPSGAMTKR